MAKLESYNYYTYVNQNLFSPLVIISAANMAFAHGANDIANAIGPANAILTNINIHAHPQILTACALSIVLGVFTLGQRIMKTVGSHITMLTPMSAFVVQVITSTIIFIFSLWGMPVSTTQTMVGAILGIGLARGTDALNLRVIGQIFLSWLITIPAGICLTLGIHIMLTTFF